MGKQLLALGVGNGENVSPQPGQKCVRAINLTASEVVHGDAERSYVIGEIAELRIRLVRIRACGRVLVPGRAVVPVLHDC